MAIEDKTKKKKTVSTKKPGTASSKNVGSKSVKKTTSTKKPSTSGAKKVSATSIKKQSSTGTKKTTSTSVKKPVAKSVSKTTATKKPVIKSVKKSTASSLSKSSVNKQTHKKSSNLKKKIEPKMTEVIGQKMKDKIVQKPKNRNSKRGKLFYLIFSLIFYAGAFFYINNILYQNQNFLESAFFAFAALFVVFVLLQFNIHMIFVNFFRLPFLYLLNQTKLEIKKEIIINDDDNNRTPFRRYRALLTLTVYLIVVLLLVGSQIYNGINDGDRVLVIITQSSLTALVFLIIVCSWQYLFNILPEVLDKSIDAKNGFILTLSAAAMVIYVVFNIFNIVYLSEMMIFILIVGFVALLGVNLNMIVGEINIFQNLKQRHSKTVTRVVFMIFFAFHLYVILYASVVAFSIYKWEPDTYNFSYESYEYESSVGVYDINNSLIGDVYYPAGVMLTEVYDSNGDVLTEYLDEDGYPTTLVFDNTGHIIQEYYDVFNNGYSTTWSPVYDEFGITYSSFYFDGSSLVGITESTKEHDYGDFLYYTVVTVSTLGYGDITPSTEYGIAQAWGGFLSIYGFTFFALSISFVSNIAIEGATSDREEDEND